MNLNETIKPQKFHAFFMFPFRFHDKFNLKKLKKIFVEQNKKWIHQPYKIAEGMQYNEYLYFYPHIRKVLFSNVQNSSNRENRAFFRFKKDEEITYTVYQDVHDFKLSLPVGEIYLHLFENGTAILAIEILVEQPAQNLKQLLQFLDYGRRLYVPFINRDAKILNSKKIYGAFYNKDDVYKDAIAATQCASKIVLKVNGKEKITDFRKQFNFDNKHPDKHYLSHIIRWLLESDNICYEKGHYHPIVDDRMYTHAYYDIYKTDEFNGNDKFLKDVKKYFEHDFSKAKINEGVKSLYQMIFIDSNLPTIANNPMFKELLDKSIYKRWIDWGTIYGFSRYSSVIISDSRKDAAPFIQVHFETMYYQIALLLFFYRGSLLSFFHRAVKIAEKIEKSKPIKELQRLQEDFILFENKYWFKEVTAQDQGIEIFDLWEKQMRNNLLLNDVKQGIQDLYTYFDSHREKRIARYITILTVIGGFLLPISIMIDLIALDVFPDQWSLSVMNMINKSVLLKGGLMICSSFLIVTSGLILYFVLKRLYLKAIQAIKFLFVRN